MKRLIAKKNKVEDQKIADTIFEWEQEHIEAFTTEVANYIKKSISYAYSEELDAFLNDEYEVREVMISVMKQTQDIFDRVFDIFYPEPESRNENDPLNPNSPIVPRVRGIIDDLDKYGHDAKDLMSPKLVEELKKIW